jgi:hypothetical protein
MMGKKTVQTVYLPVGARAIPGLTAKLRPPKMNFG